MASGPDDKRVRQNLALVLGVQGKFDEARKIASTDLPEADAKSNMAYLKSMLSAPTSVASLGPDDGAPQNDTVGMGTLCRQCVPASAPARTAMAGPPPIQARTVETPLLTRSAAAAKGDRIAAAPSSCRPVTPQDSGSTTVTKSQPVAEAAPPADAATKADKLASAPTPTRTANLLKADIE